MNKYYSEDRGKSEKSLVICPCGKEFYVTKKMLERGRGKRCSKRCQYKYPTRPKNLIYNIKKINNGWFNKGHVPQNKGIPHTDMTKEKISKKNSGKRFSPETEFKKGYGIKDKNNNWKGGITSIAQQIRHSFKYIQWRSDIFIRDDFTCKKCKVRGGKLHIHHNKKSFSVLLQEVKNNLPLLNLYDAAMIYSPLWDISNGQILCEKCHDKIKNNKGKQNG